MSEVDWQKIFSNSSISGSVAPSIMQKLWTLKWQSSLRRFRINISWSFRQILELCKNVFKFADPLPYCPVRVWGMSSSLMIIVLPVRLLPAYRALQINHRPNYNVQFQFQAFPISLGMVTKTLSSFRRIISAMAKWTKCSFQHINSE